MKVTLQNLTKKFPSRNKKQPADVIAVNDFTFEIPDGVLLGLLGPSGCGKSTTLNLLSGLQKPTSGRIFFGDDDVTDLPAENRGVGLVFQNYALYPHLTVRQNITFPLENRTGKDKLTHQQMADMALEAAKLVQIEELMDRKPKELSGGQQQRVAIARALVKMPRVLLLGCGQLACSYAVPYMVYLSFHLSGVSFWTAFALQVLCTIAVGYLPLPGAAGAAENVFLRAFAFVFGASLVAPAMILSRTVSCYLVLLATGILTAVVHFRFRPRGGGEQSASPSEPEDLAA